MKTPIEKLAARIIAETESMDYVLSDGPVRLARIAALLKKTRSEPNPEHPRLISDWCDAYENYFKLPYGFTPRDAKAASELLKIMPRMDVVELAKKAWKFREDRKNRFNCQFAVTMHGLHHHLNEIRQEVRPKLSSLSVATATEERF